MRQYALDKLNEAREAYAVRKRHLDYYMALLDLLGRREQAGYAQLLRRGVTEFDNLRAAFAQSAQFDSDPDLLTRAARGAAWLLDLPLADRLADAAVRAGGGVDANIVRGHVLSFLSRGEEADAVLAGALDHEVGDIDRARIAFARAMNKLFALADPVGAKRLIDDAARTVTPLQAQHCVDAFLTVYWAAICKPEKVRQILCKPRLGKAARRRRRSRNGIGPSLSPWRTPAPSPTRWPPPSRDIRSRCGAISSSPTPTSARCC